MSSINAAELAGYMDVGVQLAGLVLAAGQAVGQGYEALRDRAAERAVTRAAQEGREPLPEDVQREALAILGEINPEAQAALANFQALKARRDQLAGGG